MSEPASSPGLAVALVQLVGQLAWPATLLFIVWRFRPLIEALIRKLTRMKVAGAEFSFQEPAGTARDIRSPPQISLDTGPDGFLTTDTLRELVGRSGLLAGDVAAEALLQIFQTPRQRTWLAATSNHVFVLLDDDTTRTRSTVVQDLFGKATALPLEFREESGSGIVKFGSNATWWYYSLNLFPTTTSLEAAVKRLVA
jgi:hypothetical protein